MNVQDLLERIQDGLLQTVLNAVDEISQFVGEMMVVAFADPDLLTASGPVVDLIQQGRMRNVDGALLSLDLAADLRVGDLGMPGNGIKAIRFRLEQIKGEVHIGTSPTYTLTVVA